MGGSAGATRGEGSHARWARARAERSRLGRDLPRRCWRSRSTLVDDGVAVRAPRQATRSHAPRGLFRRAADRVLVRLQELGGQGHAAGADRDRPFALLPRQCLEHRRRGPIHRRRDRRRLAGGAFTQTGAGAWVLPAMLVLGALGGALYALDPGAAAMRFNANEILTSLMLVYVARPAARLSGARPVARSAGLQFPADSRFRSGGRPCRSLVDGSRLHLGALHRAGRRGGGLGRCSAQHPGGLRDQGRRRGAARRRALPASTPRSPDAGRLRWSRARSPGSPASSRSPGPIGQLLPASRRATASPRSSSPSSAGSIRSASCSPGLFLALSYLGGEAAQIALGLPLRSHQRVPGHPAVLRARRATSLILYRVRLVSDRAGAAQWTADGLLAGDHPRRSSPPRRRCCSRRPASWWPSAPACSISASRA